jgi:hypothetical protein
MSRRRRPTLRDRIGDANQILWIPVVLGLLAFGFLHWIHRSDLWVVAAPVCVLAGVAFYSGRSHATAFIGRRRRLMRSAAPLTWGWYLVEEEPWRRE